MKQRITTQLLTIKRFFIFSLFPLLITTNYSQASGPDALDGLIFGSIYNCSNDFCHAISPVAATLETTIWGVVLVIASPFVITAQYISSEDKKVIARAKIDTIYFIANNGDIQGIYLIQALKTLRKYELFQGLNEQQLIEIIFLINS